MIIANGYIERKVKSGGGINPATGFPVAPTVAWSEKTPCQYVPTTQNLLGEANGEPVAVRGYAIYLEGYEACEVIVTEQIRLTDIGAHLIGEYSVTSVTPLRAVDQTRLDVQ